MKKITSILSISLLLLVSIATIPPMVLAQTTAPSSNPLLHVGWRHIQESEEYTWDCNYEKWVFGETMKLVIINESGINIEEGNYWAGRGSPLTFTLMIPQRFFEGSTELEIAVVGASFETEGTHARFHMFYHAPSNTWHVFSGIYDSTASSSSDPAAFFNIYPASCDVTADSHLLNVSFTGGFNTSAPIGVYQTWAYATDNASNTFTPSWYNYGMTGQVPMPPIALECALGDQWWMWQKPPKYDFSILNEALDTIRYADANETVIFEMVMDQEIGFAAFEIGQVASWEQQSYWRNMTWTYPDYSHIPTTTWTSHEVPQPPHLGFYYNQSTDTSEAFIFYYNRTWVWQDYGGSYGQWVGYDIPYVDNTNITYFVDFDAATSGLVNPYKVRWYTNFTTNVCARGIHLANTTDNSGGGSTSTPGLLDPNYLGDDYGTTFRIYAWQPRHWSTQNIDGVPGEPGYEFQRSDGTILALHDIILDGYLIDHPSDAFVNQLGYNDWFNVSIDIYAPIERIEKKGDPFNASHLGYPDTFIREDLNTSYAAYVLYGYSNHANTTHNWLTSVTIQVIINLDTKTVIGQYCNLVNATYDIYSSTLVNYTSQDSYSGLPDLVNANNVVYELGEDQSYFGLQVEFLPSAPEARYWGYFDVYQNQSIWTNQTGSWELAANFTYWLGLGAKTYWTPSTFVLGSVYTWVPEVWAISDNGALDLDGDLETLDDQYFVKQVSTWHDEIRREVDSLVVHIVFDPTPGPEDVGDEFNSTNWMGLVTDTMTYTWDAKFYWYHADDMSPVNATEMTTIQDLVWQDLGEQIPALGYNGVACFARNYSWSDLQDKYWWLEDNTWECSWFGFGQMQRFELATSNNSTSWARFHSQYAGLLLFTDNTTIDGGNGIPDFTVQDGFVGSDEVTHYFLIDNVDDIEFTMPFGSTESSGTQTLVVDLDFDQDINFGVRIFDVNGTLYPVHTTASSRIHSCYDYYNSPDSIAGLNASAFDYTLSSATIDEMAFDVNYNVHLANSTANPDPNNNLISIKVDQYIGDWTLHHFEDAVLEGRSLCIAYFGDLSTSTYTEYSVDDTPVGTNNDDSEIGDMYSFGAEGRTFAQIQMGGQEYLWGGDGGIYNCSAATVPLGAFSAMYQASDGTTVASWEISGTLFFMLSSFLNWDGHSIDNDPSFGIYTTALDMVVTGGDGGFDPTLLVIIVVFAAIVAIVAVVVMVNIRRRGPSKGKTAREPEHDYWIESEPKVTD